MTIIHTSNSTILEELKMHIVSKYKSITRTKYEGNRMKYLIECKIPKNLKTIYQFPMYMELKIEDNPINFSIILLCWSNNKQKNVPLLESIIMDSLLQEDFKKCIDYYENMKNKYLKYLYKNINNQNKVKKLISTIESPQFIYPKQLVEKFGKNILDYTMKNIFKSVVVLDLDSLEFIPKPITGWYSDNIEVTASGNFNHDAGEEITSQQALNILFKASKTEIEKLLNLCAKKWIEYCGISVSSRTLYWDIALSVCKEIELFEEYILSYSDGKESLDYDVCICDAECYEDIKNKELSLLEENEQALLLFGYNILISDLEITKQT